MAAETKKAEKTVTDRFLAASGYEASDVIASDEARRIFVTANGGKYRYAKGGEVVTLLGPEPPKAAEESEEG